MDIRFINSEGELINVSNMSIKVIGGNLIGIDGEKNVVVIESYKSEEDAKKALKIFIDYMVYLGIKRTKEDNILMDLRFQYDTNNEEEKYYREVKERYQESFIDLGKKKEEEDGKPEQDKKEYKDS